MKHIIYCLSLFFLSCSDQGTKTNAADAIKIDSSWQKKSISDVVTISLPDSSVFNKKGILNASFGTGKFGLYGVDFYDTIVVYIQNEADFRTALKGYLTGKFADPALRSYDLTIVDTTVGNSNGYFLTGYTNDSLTSCKYPFCYFTVANNNFYWFYACQSTSAISDETRQFFHSIQFNREKFKEADYQLAPVSMHKKARLE